MTIDSAKAYMQRMREDPEFRRRVNKCEDTASNWAFLKEMGFEFTSQEFKEAQKEVYEEYGTDQLPKKE